MVTRRCKYTAETVIFAGGRLLIADFCTGKSQPAVENDGADAATARLMRVVLSPCCVDFILLTTGDIDCIHFMVVMKLSDLGKVSQLNTIVSYLEKNMQDPS